MNVPLPSWSQPPLGVEAGLGNRIAWHWQNEWPWPAWATFALMVLLIAMTASTYWREDRRVGARWKAALASLRLLSIGIVLAMFARYSLVAEQVGPAPLTILVDDSASMTTVDTYPNPLGERLASRLQAAGLPEPTSRNNLVKLFLLENDEKRLRRLANGYDLRLRFTNRENDAKTNDVESLARAVRSVEADGPTSPLGEALMRAIDDPAGPAPATIVFLTDGANTQGPDLSEAASLARRRGVGLWIVALGQSQPAVDLALSDPLVDDAVMVGDTVGFEATLTASGCEGRPSRVTLSQEGRPGALAEARVTAGRDGRPQPVRLFWQPEQIGRFRLILEVEPLEGETNADNNRLVREIEVRDARVRVLFAQACPSYEYRYLRAALARDPTIELKTFLQDADPAHAAQDSAALAVFPVGRESLSDYDVIILGDVDFERLGRPALDNLAAFVARPIGGSLVFIAGPEYNPAALRGTSLEPLLPVALAQVRMPPPEKSLTDGFPVEPTRLGLACPFMQLGDSPEETRAIWAHLPPLYWMIDAPELKPGARVLAVNPKQTGHDGRPRPVICMQYAGVGRIMMHMTDETWRWRRGVGDRDFARYWIQAVRYLARTKLLGRDARGRLETDQPDYRPGETVRFRLRAGSLPSPGGDEGFALVVENNGQRVGRLSLTRRDDSDAFEATLDDAAPGRYHAWLSGLASEGERPSVDFTVSSPNAEFDHDAMAADSLRRAADESGGRFYTIADADRLFDDLPPRRWATIDTLPPRPVWRWWPVVALLLASLCAEWILRKWKGLI